MFGNVRNSEYSRNQNTFIIGLMLVALTLVLMPGQSFANPSGEQVVTGAATFSTAGSVLTVTNDPGTIIHWNDFSIAAGETTDFVQQSSASTVLNRVVGLNPSDLLGTLTSNGQVYLINPNGILFGASAQIDVGGLVASTLDMTNADFLSGTMLFNAGASAGSIENQGVISTSSGGNIYLIAPDITNTGLITAPDGAISLAAGHSVELIDSTRPDLSVVVSSDDDQALNLGTLLASGGSVDIYGALVRQSGTVSADSASIDNNGRIYLRASDSTTLDAGSLTSADGGTITIDTTNGDTIVAGSVSTASANSTGGTISLLGNRVGLAGTATIDASGDTGGGTVLIGGDFQGKNPLIHNSTATTVASGATIQADAIDSGDGGRVIVWSDGTTRYAGDISVNAGATAGNGGFVEVSGKQNLDFQGQVRAAAPNGSDGTLLLDPTQLYIVNGLDGSRFYDAQLDVQTPYILFADTDNTPLTANRVSVGALQSLGDVNITLQASELLVVGDAGGNAANVDLSSSLITASNYLTLQAGDGTTPGTVTFNTGSTITTGGGSVAIDADDPNGITNLGGIDTTNGNIEVRTAGDIYINAPLNAGTGGGDVILYSSSGAIIDGNSVGTDIYASSLALEALTGIGSIDPLETDVLTLSAFNNRFGDIQATDNIQITNISPLNVESWQSGEWGVYGLLNGSGNIVLDNAAELTNTEAGMSAQGNLTLIVRSGALVSKKGEGPPTLNADHLLLDLADGVLYDDGFRPLYYAPFNTSVNSVEIIHRGSGSVGINNSTGLPLLITGVTANNPADPLAPPPVIEIANSDNLVIGGTISATDYSVTLSAPFDEIIDGNASGVDIDAFDLTLISGLGIGNGNALDTTVALLNAYNDVYGGNIEISNTEVLDIWQLVNMSGDVILDNYGAVSFNDRATATATGAFTVTAHSPLTVGTNGITSDGNIVLSAAPSGAGDILTINGNLVSNTGSIILSSGDTIVQAVGLNHFAPGGIFLTENLNAQAPTTPQRSSLYAVQAGLDSVLDPTADPDADPDKKTREGDNTDEPSDNIYCN